MQVVIQRPEPKYQPQQENSASHAGIRCLPERGITLCMRGWSRCVTVTTAIVTSAADWVLTRRPWPRGASNCWPATLPPSGPANPVAAARRSKKARNRRSDRAPDGVRHRWRSRRRTTLDHPGRGPRNCTTFTASWPVIARWPGCSSMTAMHPGSITSSCPRSAIPTVMPHSTGSPHCEPERRVPGRSFPAPRAASPHVRTKKKRAIAAVGRVSGPHRCQPVAWRFPRAADSALRTVGENCYAQTVRPAAPERRAVG